MGSVISVFIQSGYWAQIIIFFAGSMLFCYLHGVFWQRLLKFHTHPFENFGIGLVSILALEEALCWPVIAFRQSAGLLVAGTLIVLILPSCAAFFLPKHGKAEEKRTAWYLLAAVVLIVGYQICSSTVLYKLSSDDSFYVSNVALFAAESPINVYDSSMGDVSASTVPMYDFQVWEGLIAVVCRIFHLSAAAAMHTLVIPPLLFCSASAYFSLGKTFFKDNGKAFAFLAVISIFHLGCRFVNYSEGRFLLTRIWQGKSVNLVVVLPLLSAWTLQFFLSENKRIQYMLLLATLAGAALNPTSLYVNGFEFLFLSVALTLVVKQPRRLTVLIPSVIVIAFFSLMIYWRTRQCVGMIENSSVADSDFFQTARSEFFEHVKTYLLLYFAAVLYILFKGDKAARAFFLLTGVLMLLVLWNPWVGRFVAEKITKLPTYWRVFWLVPLGAGIAWAAVDLAFSIPKKPIVPFALAALMLIVGISGQWPEDEFKFAPNVEKIPANALTLGQKIVDDHIETPVLAFSTVATNLRQEYANIWLLVSREMYVRDVYQYFGRTEDSEDRMILSGFVNQTLDADKIDTVSDLLEKYQVECVVIARKNTTAADYLKNLGWSNVAKEGSYHMYYAPSLTSK